MCGRALSPPKTVIDNYLQAAADLTADMTRGRRLLPLCTSTYGNPITIAASDRTAWTADQSIRPFRVDRS